MKRRCLGRFLLGCRSFCFQKGQTMPVCLTIRAVIAAQSGAELDAQQGRLPPVQLPLLAE
jgi:hypothetical protein